MARQPQQNPSIARRMQALRGAASGVKPAKTKPAKTKPAKTKPAKTKPNKPGARAERSAARREAILAAALDEFSARGFAATRLDDVAQRAGVAKGTIYLYFRDKESLFQELIRTMLTPIVGTIESLGQAELPFGALAQHIAELFVREIYETRRKDVIRLMIAEGQRFPALAEFYYREVLSRIIAAVRALIARAVARGEAPVGLVDFPQLIAAPGLVAIIWSGLFERFEPLDVRKMMQTHLALLFAPGRPE